MNRVHEWIVENPWVAPLIGMAVGCVIVAVLKAWRRAPAGAPKAEPEPVPLPAQPAPYASFEEFRRDLVNEDVSVHEVFARCDGVIPPPRPAAPPPEPVAVCVSDPAPDGTVYVVRRGDVTGLWEVVMRWRGASTVMSAHMMREDAVKQAGLYRRYT